MRKNRGYHHQHLMEVKLKAWDQCNLRSCFGSLKLPLRLALYGPIGKNDIFLELWQKKLLHLLISILVTRFTHVTKVHPVLKITITQLLTQQQGVKKTFLKRYFLNFFQIRDLELVGCSPFVPNNNFFLSFSSSCDCWAITTTITTCSYFLCWILSMSQKLSMLTPINVLRR